EVAAARRFEQLENRMAVINEAQRAAPAAPRIDRRAKLSRQERRALVGPRAVLAKDDQHTAAALDEACEDAIGERGRKGDIVQHHDWMLFELRKRQLARRHGIDLKRRRRADR